MKIMKAKNKIMKIFFKNHENKKYNFHKKVPQENSVHFPY